MALELKRIDISNVDELQKVFERSPEHDSKDRPKSALEALPPNITSEDKLVFLIQRDGENIGAIDLIRGYPNLDTAYIGLLLICEDMQGRGFGRKSYELLERYILNELGLGKIQLSYVESNAVEKYWSKLGFYITGEKKNYVGVNDKSFPQKMEKELMLFLEPEEYQEKVNNLFLQVQSDLDEILNSKRFEHIGASSIKGSVSKGDLDIFLGVGREEFDSTIKRLFKVGFIEKEGTLRTDELCMMVTEKYNYDVAIQVVVNGSEFEDFIKFRDFMRSRPDLVEHLNQLKRDCRGFTAQRYREIKSAWVENVINEYLA